MKPSEVENTTHRGPTFARYVYNDGRLSGSVNTTEGYTLKRRVPLDYQPKTYWRPLPRKHKFYSIYKILQPKPYTCEVRVEKCLVAVRTRDQKTYKQLSTWSGRLVNNPPLLVQSQIENLRIEANVNFLNKVNERKYTMLEEIKNRRESGLGLYNSAKKLINLFRKFKKNPLRMLRKVPKAFRSRRTIDSVGDAWLEYRYFWMPIYLTMKSAFEELIPDQEHTPVYSKTKARFNYDAPCTTSNWAEFFKEEPTYNVTAVHEFKRGCQIAAKDLVSTERKLGISSLPDIAAVGWELIPFSFVVDWIYPVSDVLLALGSKQSLTTHCDYQVHKVTYHCKLNPVKLRDSGTGYLTSEYRIIQYGSIDEAEFYSRTINASSTLDIAPFVASQPLNWRRTLDAFALFGTGKDPLIAKAYRKVRRK